MTKLRALAYAIRSAWAISQPRLTANSLRMRRDDPAASQAPISPLAGEFFCEHIECVNVAMCLIEKIAHCFKKGVFLISLLTSRVY